MHSENRLSFEETKDAMASKLLALDKKSRQGIISITEVGDFFPVGVVINSRNGENLYMNAMSEQILGYSTEETRELGKNYAKAIQYDEKETREILNEIDNFFCCQDDSAILAQFQRLRPKHKKGYEWMYIASKLICEKPDQPASKRLLIAAPVSHMGNMNCKIARVLEENLYMKKNFKRFAALTKREKELLSLVAIGKESKEISEMLFISRYTVEQHRKNIAKKVEHRNFTELIKFAMAFDLI